MSVYSKKGKGWRYDFTIRGQRYTEAWFKTKRVAQRAENDKRKELEQPKETQTDMDFLELVNRRLDHVRAYNSDQHYVEHVGRAKRWVKRWARQSCAEISRTDIESFILERSKVSAHTANKELRRLRATFNFAKKRGWLQTNPTDGIEFLSEEKKLKFVPTPEQVEAVIAEADPGTQDYLWTIRDTMGRMSEINKLKWADVDLENQCVVLYTRKKRGGHLTPRRVPMTERLYEIMLRRWRERDPSKPWVFWHTYWSSKTGEKCEGPYKARSRIMRTLCSKAGVPYFRFHALRHSGASTLDGHKVSMGAIQRILGHESRFTTELYLHSIRDTEREAVRVLDGNVIPFSPKKSHTDSHTATTEQEAQSA